MSGISIRKRFVQAAFVTVLAISAALAGPLQVSASATPETTVYRVLVPEQSMYDNCSGEEILMSGEMLLLAHTNHPASGREQFHYAILSQTLSGVSLTSGRLYHFVGGTSNVYTAGSAFVAAVNSTFNLISQGSNDNQLLHELIHITFNSNGEPTAEVVRFSFECRG